MMELPHLADLIAIDAPWVLTPGGCVLCDECNCFNVCSVMLMRILTDFWARSVRHWEPSPLNCQSANVNAGQIDKRGKS